VVEAAAPEGDGSHVTRSLRDMTHGNLAAFATASSICIHLIVTKKLRSHIPLVPFVTVQMMLASLITTFGVAWGLLGATFTQDPWTGVLGFLNPIWMASLVLGGLLMFNAWGGTVVVTKYLNPVVISSFLTLEPPVAVVLAFLMGAEGFPNWTTVMGGLLMVAGTLVVSVTSRDDADGTHVPIILDGMQGMPHVTQDLVVAANAELATPTAPTTPLTPLTATARQAR